MKSKAAHFSLEQGTWRIDWGIWRYMNYYCPLWLRTVWLWRLQAAYLLNYLLNEKLNELCRSWVQLSPDQITLWFPAKVLDQSLFSILVEENLKRTSARFSAALSLFTSLLLRGLCKVNGIPQTSPKMFICFLPLHKPIISNALESHSKYQRAFWATSPGSFLGGTQSSVGQLEIIMLARKKKIKIDFKGQLWHGQLIIKTVF